MYVKGVALSDLQRITPQASQVTVLASVTSLFWFMACDFTVLVDSHQH